MSFIVTKPQVFLIEDLTSKTSRAAIVTADFDVRFFVYGAQQKVNGHAKGLQMFKTTALTDSIEVSIRHVLTIKGILTELMFQLTADKQFNILKPADIIILLEMSPETFDLHVELSPLDLTLSYRVSASILLLDN